MLKGPLTVSMQICQFLANYCSFLGQQKLNYSFINRSTYAFKYILTLVLEKLIYLLHDFSQFYEEGYMKFLVS